MSVASSQFFSGCPPKNLSSLCLVKLMFLLFTLRMFLLTETGKYKICKHKNASLKSESSFYADELEEFNV